MPPGADAARRPAAPSGAVNGGGVLRSGTTTCGTTRSSGRKSPGIEALSRFSSGVNKRGPGFDASGDDAGALAGDAALWAAADSIIEAASAAAATGGNQ